MQTKSINIQVPDWIEIVSKKGNKIMLGDLETLTKRSIKDNEYDEDQQDYHIKCPYCQIAYKYDNSYHGNPYTKYKLYVTKDYGIGHCFRCDRTFINQSDNVIYDISVPEPPISMQDFELCKLSGKVWNLDLFNQFDEFDQDGYDYLIHKRHFYFKKLYKLLGIRFSNSNPVIPFYYHGELIYYQIKMAFGNSKLPYFSPPIIHKPAYIIEHGDNKKFVISEGTFDGIADLILYPDRTPFCLLGSSITDYQVAMLRTYIPEDILIYMDDTELSQKVADKISRFIPYADIHIKYSDGTDPEEFLKAKLLKETE